MESLNVCFESMMLCISSDACCSRGESKRWEDVLELLFGSFAFCLLYFGEVVLSNGNCVARPEKVRCSGAGNYAECPP